MTLKDLGYNEQLETYRQEHQLEHLEPGRVIAEHKERYIVKTLDGEYQAELLGNLRFTAESRHDLPAVGDWVALSPYDEDKALIHAVFPRSSTMERLAVGQSGQTQIIATNVDYALIVLGADRDFNLNRLERYFTICHASKVAPIVVLNKIDLLSADERSAMIAQLAQRVPADIPVFPVSSLTQEGLEPVAAMITQGKTFCLLGSSGAGKSTLLNQLAGKEEMKTGAISSAVQKGKHTTTHRELIVLESGGILIDNPGLREVGIADAAGGLELTFDGILELAASCKFTDCTHQHEQGCAVLEALESGSLDADAYDNFLKMQRERDRFQRSKAEQRRKDKSQGKLYKRIQAEKRNRKY